MSDQLLPGSPRCPRCSALVDDCTAVDLSGARPEHGDRTICLYCATPCAFVVTGNEYSLRLLSPLEQQQALANHEYRRALAVVRLMKMTRSARG